MDAQSPKFSFSEPWLRRFAPIWGAQVFSLLGSGLVSFALVWYLTQSTGSAAVLATATLVALLPEVFLSPFAGALVDRWNRRVVMIVADSLIALVTVGLVVLFWSGLVQTWHIYVILFLRTLGGVFHWPAMQASTSLMVPERFLARLAGINQAMRGALNIVAPPLAALLLSLTPIYAVLAVDIVTAAIAVSPLFFIAIPQPQRSAPNESITPRRLLLDIRDGFRYLRTMPGLLLMILMATLINLVFSPAMSLLPLLVTKEYGGGVWELSLFESLFGIGVVAGGVLLGVWGGFKRKTNTAALGLIGMGLFMLAPALSPAALFSLAAAGMGLAGSMNSLVNGSFFAIVQSRITPEMQGRVFSLIASLASAMSPIGLAFAAPVAEWLGIRAWFLTGSLVTLLLGAGSLFIPAIRHLEDTPAVALTSESAGVNLETQPVS